MTLQGEIVSLHRGIAAALLKASFETLVGLFFEYCYESCHEGVGCGIVIVKVLF